MGVMFALALSVLPNAARAQEEPARSYAYARDRQTELTLEPAGDNDPKHWVIEFRRHEPAATLYFVGALQETTPGVLEIEPGEGGARVRVTGQPGAGSALKMTSRNVKLKRVSLDPRCDQEVARPMSGTFQPLSPAEQLERARGHWQQAEAIMQAAYARAQAEVGKAGRARLERLQRYRLDVREDWADYATQHASQPEQQVAYWKAMLEYTLDQIEFLKIYAGSAVPSGLSGRYRAMDRGWLDLQETPKGLKFRLTTFEGYTVHSRKPGDSTGLARWHGNRATYRQAWQSITLIFTKSTGHRIHLASEGMERYGGAGGPYVDDFYKVRNLARPIDLAYRAPWDP